MPQLTLFPLQAGRPAIHRLTGKELTVWKDYGSVVSCRMKEPIRISEKSHRVTYAAICLKRNLIY